MQCGCKSFLRLNNYQVIKNITTTIKETTTGKSPSSCKSTSSEIKAHEVQASPKRLVTVAKLPVELLEDHFAEQLNRLASKELTVYMYSRNHVTAMCHPSLIQHIRRYPGLSFKYKSN